MNNLTGERKQNASKKKETQSNITTHRFLAMGGPCEIQIINNTQESPTQEHLIQKKLDDLRIERHTCSGIRHL